MSMISSEPDYNIDFSQYGIDPSIKEIHRTEVEQMLAMVFGFFSAYQMGDTPRMARILSILIAIAKVKQGLPTLQDYFKGRKIGLYRDHITKENASLWVAHISDQLKMLNDPRVKCSPIE